MDYSTTENSPQQWTTHFDRLVEFVNNKNVEQQQPCPLMLYLESDRHQPYAKKHSHFILFTSCHY